MIDQQTQPQPSLTRIFDAKTNKKLDKPHDLKYNGQCEICQSFH